MGLKVCVSLNAKNLADLFELVECTPGSADLIEIRFDALDQEELNLRSGTESAPSRLLAEYPDKQFVFTFRPKSEGGFREIEDLERRRFWEICGAPAFWDQESEFSKETKPDSSTKLITSKHFLEPLDALPPLNEIFGRGNEADLVKLAVASKEPFDAISLMKLGNEEGIIPISMGQRGMWTRVLAPVFEIPVVYASLRDDMSTAPGQLSYRKLTEVYRIREITSNTDVYGLVGNSLSRSQSPKLHNAIYRQMGLDAVYIPFECDELETFVKRMVKPSTREIDLNIKGFAVTIPFKERIVDSLDFLDPVAEAIGAVNTVCVVGESLVGFNTDAEGFIRPMLEAIGSPKNKRVAVFGSGGAAKACVYALRDAGAAVTVFTRNKAAGKSLAIQFGCESRSLEAFEKQSEGFSIAVNATPLGSAGKLKNSTPAKADQLKNFQLAYDLVYNPRSTLFLREAEKAGVRAIGGLPMLIRQGVLQIEIWTGQKVPANVTKNIPFD
ncbi:MAG: shikimate dehydrogenase [Pyrinomonadaceae bacterium]|nr:shikimate dehydrogenase [Pyrinomonadaceae bacterium]